MHVGQSEVATLVAEGEAFVVKDKLVGTVAWLNEKGLAATSCLRGEAISGEIFCVTSAVLLRLG